MESGRFNFGKRNEDSILRQLNMRIMVSDWLSIDRKITSQKLALEG